MTESLAIHSYSAVLSELRARIHEPPSGRVQLLSGPRQVGKTTALTALAEEWGTRAIYAAADAPEAALPGWWDLLWQRAEKLAEPDRAVLFLDEIQYLAGWSRLLKSRVDRIKRLKIPLHVVVTGSSSLQLGHGTKETMAGRFERLCLHHWPAKEIASCFGLEPAVAAHQAVQFGTYPGAMSLLADANRWRRYVRDSILEPAIGHDVLMMETIRKPALLRQVFAIAAGHPAEIVSLQKICGQLAESGAIETVAHYLHVLEEACLVAAVHGYSARGALRQRATPPKLIVLNNGLLAAAGDQPAPAPETEPERWGRWVENACLAHAWNAGQKIHYWRSEPYEVDLIVAGSWGKWAIEIKSGRYGLGDLSGLTEFCRRFPDHRPLVVCRQDDTALARGAGLASMSWESFLLGSPADEM